MPLNRRRALQQLLTAPALATGLGLPLARASGPLRLGAAEARSDLQVLRRGLEGLHAGLHRRATPAQIDAAFAAAEAAVAGGCSRAALFLQCSRIAAAVNCGHTWASRYNARVDLKAELFTGADKLPCTLRWVQGRALVTGSAAPGMAAGSELLAIDGRPAGEIAAALLPLLRADGTHAGAVGKRWAQLDSGPNGSAMDWLFPLAFPPQQGRWRLTLRSGTGTQTLALPALTLAERQRTLPETPPPWGLQREGDTAVLRITTFAFWNSSFKADAFLARTFQAIRGLPYLVLDLRACEGGDDNIARLLLSHLLRQPYEAPAEQRESAYEKAPPELLPLLGTWERSFFDRSGQATRTAAGRWLLAPRPPLRVEPVAAPYPGRTVALVGPQNSSAAFLLARNLQRSGAAVLMGEPTAGHLRGLNSGQIAWLTLPASGVAVDIPLRASHVQPDDGEPLPDRGVLPELAVAPRWDDAVAGTDTVMEAARALVRGWRPGTAPAVVPGLAPTS
ncbi:hypothetical protein IP87_04530 [beta proteobacterium AAP121]|nr:hypothetical protein IP80_06640 [beta proteobacterium AAP65]KPF99748.1 hypothetical protein IP87_04530 [beta proteobacterium AAP121]